MTHPGYYGKWRYTSGSENITINIPPLVSKEIFNRIQRLSSERKRRANQKYTYLLADYLYCGNCKRRMSVRGRTTIRRIKDKTYGPYVERHYYCLGRTLKKGCKTVWIRTDRIDSIVWEEIKKYIKSPVLLKQAIEKKYEKDRSKLEPLKTELIKTAGTAQKLELEEDNILRLYRKGKITEEKFDKQAEEIRIAKQTLNQRQKEIELLIENQKHIKTRLNTLEELMERIHDSIDNLTFEKKREMIGLLVDKIFIKEDGKIQLNLVIPNFWQSKTQQTWPLFQKTSNLNAIAHSERNTFQNFTSSGIILQNPSFYFNFLT